MIYSLRRLILLKPRKKVSRVISFFVCIVLCFVLHGIELDSILLYCIVLHCTVLFRVICCVLPCVVLLLFCFVFVRCIPFVFIPLFLVFSKLFYWRFSFTESNGSERTIWKAEPMCFVGLLILIRGRADPEIPISPT